MGRKVKASTRKRSTRKRTQRGKGVRDILRKAHSLIKSHKLVSRGLRMAGKPGLANAAAMMGYGRGKKKNGTRKRSVGVKGTLGAILRAAKPVRRRTKKSTMRGRGILGLTKPSLSTPGIRSMTGRGFFGKTLGGLAGGALGGLLPF